MDAYNDYYNEVPVSCYWNFRKRVQIEYDGLVWQCCHLSGVYGSSAGFSKKEYQYYVDKFGWNWRRAVSDSKKYKSGSMMKSVLAIPMS